MDVAEMAEAMALAMSQMEGRLVQQMDSIRQEIRKQPNYRKVRRVWMPLGEYVRSRFLERGIEAKKQWIRRRLVYGEDGRDRHDGRVRALLVRSPFGLSGNTWIHTEDADRLLGFEE